MKGETTSAVYNMSTLETKFFFQLELSPSWPAKANRFGESECLKQS